MSEDVRVYVEYEVSSREMRWNRDNGVLEDSGASRELVFMSLLYAYNSRQSSRTVARRWRLTARGI